MWGVRPIGLQTIANAILQATSKHDFVLRRQLQKELAAITGLSRHLVQFPPPPADTLHGNGNVWSPGCLRWCERTVAKPLDLLPDLLSLLSKSLVREQYSFAAYLTRRIAAEFADAGWTSAELLHAAYTKLCTSGAYDNQSFNEVMMREALGAVLTRSPGSTYYVTISLAPVTVSTVVVKRLSGGRDLILRGSYGTSPRLLGVGNRVVANHPSAAAAAGLDRARNLIDILRLGYSVSTHVHGVVRVIDESTGVETTSPLPQPFWPRAGRSRAIPRVLQNFTSRVRPLPDTERRRWYAARWHISQAFARWAEDPHGAAAASWQALESYGTERKRGLARAFTIMDLYVPALPMELGAYLGIRTRLQSLEISTLDSQITMTWYYWLSHRMPILTWFRRILSPKSTNYFLRWTPEAPALLFERECGLARIVLTALESGKDHNWRNWMARRLMDDLTLLYGLRNKAVHEGTQLLTQRAAAYLGRVAFEVLCGAMTERLKGIATPATSPIEEPGAWQ